MKEDIRRKSAIEISIFEMLLEKEKLNVEILKKQLKYLMSITINKTVPFFLHFINSKLDHIQHVYMLKNLCMYSLKLLF